MEAKAKELAVAKLLSELKIAQQSASAWCVYLFRCADGTLYTGITNDLTRRASSTTRVRPLRYTRSRLPVELIYQESQASHSLALKRELSIKALSRPAKELLVQSAG